MLWYLLHIVILLCVTFKHGVCHDSWALSFELPDNEKQCFFHDFKESKNMVLAYEVVGGGKFDVDVTIESPNGKEIYKEVKKTKGEHQFETSWGTYSFCFSNEFSTFTHKIVYFELKPYGHDSLAVEAGKKKPTVDTQVEHSMEIIHSANTQVIF